MNDPLTLTSAFLLGLFSTMHCVGMCGGIIGALSLSVSTKALIWRRCRHVGTRLAFTTLPKRKVAAFGNNETVR